MRSDRLFWILIPVAALIAVLPLILQGPSCGHDYDFHILNWFEVATQFAHGNLHPQWAVSPAYNAGEPRFLFYPPISWTLGAILGLLVTTPVFGHTLGSWTAIPTLYTWIVLTASGFSLYRLARAYATPTASLLAATLYIANPYMLFTAYERTAYAELLAAIWFPLLIQAILKPRPAIPAIALPLALLWLTNAPAAVMGTYTLALLAAIRLIQARKQQALPLALITVSGTLLGLALAAYYIIPAASDRRLVQIAMVILPGMRIDDNTLFHHTGLSEDALMHDAVLHSASIVAILLIAVTAGALLITLLRKDKAPALPLAILATIITFLLTRAALPIWHHAPELEFLQFPWRFVAVLAAIACFSVALAIKQITLRPIPTVLLALAIASALTIPATRTFRQSCDDPDTVPARLAVYQSQTGSDPTDEYTPTTADNDLLKENNPPFWLSPDSSAPAPPNSKPSPLPLDFKVTSPTAQKLILNLRAYPNWHILLNGTESPSDRHRRDGLIFINVPAGTTHIHLAFVTTPLEWAADALSALALILLLVLTRLSSKSHA
ncbi:hypothetical protein [Granulicella sibirica]|uniref:Membrane protein 6-pyruvoyl-tetrahydropterin synthase-related domain-containing protein n=1 Tax=Granulicella sibirica TaxID=2479048 RepID=A0A4Q0SYY9_9BACT|nr:hypothetical protein [Granulicella sibirica]RXH56057.1 hypothetical protein GRAN_2914 [Granulicella sibirica]